MSISGISSGDANLALADKMLEVVNVKAKLNAQNIANWMVDGAKEVKIAKSFEDQLKTAIDSGHYEEIAGMKVSTEDSSNPISYEKVMRDVKATMVQTQFLEQVMSTHFKRLETAIEK